MRRRMAMVLAGGAAVAWPHTVLGQQRDKQRRLAVLIQADPIDSATGKRDRAWAAFFDELRRLGYEESGNLEVRWRSTDGDARHVAEVARDVVASGPDVIFSPDSRMAGVLKAATGSIPIVVITLAPVGSGLAASLARPGSNVTGFSIDAGLEIFAKRFDLLKQAVPSVLRTGWLVPRRVIGLPFIRTIRDAARQAGITLIDAVLESPVDAGAYRDAFAAMARDGVDSVWAGGNQETLTHRRVIAELATAAKLPSMFAYRENVEAGGLMSYGNDARATFRRSASYVARILGGADPAELPFQQPALFEMVINLKTARLLGLTLPAALLARADEVIE